MKRKYQLAKPQPGQKDHVIDEIEIAADGSETHRSAIAALHPLTRSETVHDVRELLGRVYEAGREDLAEELFTRTAPEAAILRHVRNAVYDGACGVHRLTRSGDADTIETRLDGTDDRVILTVNDNDPVYEKRQFRVRLIVEELKP